MTDQLRQAAQQALDAMERINRADDDCDFLNESQGNQLFDAIESLRSALAAAPQAEPSLSDMARFSDAMEQRANHITVMAADMGGFAQEFRELYRAYEAYRLMLTDVIKERDALKAAAPAAADVVRDAERLDWLERRLFAHRWNGVVGAGSAVSWYIVPDYRHTMRLLEQSPWGSAGNFRAAIDAAMKGAKS